MGKISKKKIKRVSKTINILVSVIMILQPVGTPGILGAYFLANKAMADTADTSVDQGTTASQDNSAKTDNTAKDSVSGTPKNESGSQSGSNNSGNVNNSGSAASNEQSTPNSGANIGVEDANPADSSANTETGTQSSGATGAQENNAGVSSDTSSALPATDANGKTPDSGTISPDAAAAEAPAETQAAQDPVTKENGDLNTFVAENVKANSVDLDSIDPKNTDQTAELATDKADYAPTDTVIITGTGFTAGKTYILKITSKDSPPVSHKAEVTADENGQFVYAYQLDGNYRPDYTVTVSDGNGNELAKTTFKDSIRVPTLTVKKVLIPSSDAGKFNLQIDGATAGTGANVGDGGTTGAVFKIVGSHTVRETAGTATSLASYDAVISGDCSPSGNITLAAGENKVCTITNTRRGSVIAHKFKDNDLNGIQGISDANLADWEMSLYSGDNCQTGNFMQSGITGADGNYVFNNLTIGNYSVKETLQSGWQNSTPICQNVAVTPGNASTADFGNFQLGKISGYKFNDLDGNGNWDKPDELGLENWTINLCKYENNGQTCNPAGSTTTDANGYYEFTGLQAGLYKISEVLQPGWTQTAPAGQVYDNVNVQSGTGVNGNAIAYDFGNQFVAPRLEIEKANNKFPIDQHPGDDVTYTLAITALDNDVNDVHVTDLSPNGFVYRGGTWTAHSDVRGDLKSLGITTEPVYNLSGDWSLGDMKKDEIVTLTYLADISTSQESGLYPDLAWTQGVDSQNNEVLGAGINSNFVQDAFVGTKVSVVRPLAVEPASVKIATDTKTEHKSRKIVRKTVTLPATGASPWWLAVAFTMLLAGAGFLIVGRRKKRR